MRGLYFFDMLFIGVCKNKHWHTYGQRVLEFNGCTVQVVPLKKTDTTDIN